MLIIHKYLTREILKYFVVILAMVIGIYLAVDFFEKIDDFIEAGLPLSKALMFFIFQIPFVAAQMVPAGLLLAVLVTFGIMNKNNEILAIKSSGVSVYFMLKPVLAIGLLFSILLFLLFEVIVPFTIGKANDIYLRQVTREDVISSDENIWIKGNREIKHINYYDAVKKTIFGITFNYFDDKFNLIRRVDAEKGRFDGENWHLQNIMEQTLDKPNEKYQIQFYNERIEKFDLKPEDLQRVSKKSEEMNFKELLAHIKKIEDEGYDAINHRVDLYAKFSFPLICFILSIIGAGIALRGNNKEGLPLSITFGIGVAFLYWTFYSFCVSLGYGDMLHPVIAVGTANFVFLCLGILLLLNVE